ncbi:ABC transporter substrate-binding protein [Streptomyces sp. NPDC054847]
MSGRLKARTAAMVLATAMLSAACGGTDDAAMPADPKAVEGSITFWTYPIGVSGEDDYWDPVVKEFKKKYPNADVEVVVQPFEKREETLVTAIAGGQGPDVVYFNPDFIPKFAVEGTLEPVGDVIEDDRGDFKESALESMTWDGQLYGVPLLMQTLTAVCNTKVLADSGVDECPRTWDELEAMAPKVKKAGYVPTDYVAALTLTLNHSYYPYLWQAGGEVLNEDGTKAAFNSPEGLAALQFIKKMVDEGWTSRQSLTNHEPVEQSDMGRGKTAFVPASSVSALRQVLPASTSEHLRTSPPLTGKVQVAAGSVGGLSVLAASEAKPAAKAWVDFLTGPQQMKKFNKENGYYAPRDSGAGIFADDPEVAEGEKYLDVVRTGVMHPKARELMDLIKPHLQAALLGKVEPEAALAAAEKEVNALLARG